MYINTAMAKHRPDAQRAPVYSYTALFGVAVLHRIGVGGRDTSAGGNLGFSVLGL